VLVADQPRSRRIDERLDRAEQLGGAATNCSRVGAPVSVFEARSLPFLGWTHRPASPQWAVRETKKETGVAVHRDVQPIGRVLALLKSAQTVEKYVTLEERCAGKRPSVKPDSVTGET
jgi:hypothetical protein